MLELNEEIYFTNTRKKFFVEKNKDKGTFLYCFIRKRPFPGLD